MIFLTSRYAKAGVVSVYFPEVNRTVNTTFRTPPTKVSGKSVTYYQWAYGDTIGNVANKLFGDPELWWKILDLNPEILDPYTLNPGDIIRIPKL
jgi:hypothetical protein